jgi:glycosyltransferase involved in cell wall biosynthesis
VIPDISVVVCVYNGADSLGDCLRALEAQSLPRQRYEIIVVDDGSSDKSAEVARGFDVRLQQTPHRGLAAARNSGWQAAEGEWVAFTDDDCGPTRNWLLLLSQAVRRGGPDGRVLGVAGRLAGFPSSAPISRYVELTGGFNTDRHLAHPVFPYAPMGNIMYSREALASVAGLDERYRSYEACDLHTRLLRLWAGAFYYEPRAVVLHHHHTTWKEYWFQQCGYGRGVGQFMWHHRAQVSWSAGQEAQAWLRVGALACRAAWPGRDERALLRRGDLVRHLALRIGFMQTYWSRKERARWP